MVQAAALLESQCSGTEEQSAAGEIDITPHSAALQRLYQKDLALRARARSAIRGLAGAQRDGGGEDDQCVDRTHSVPCCREVVSLSSPRGETAV